jgi:hypothetical protein
MLSWIIGITPINIFPSFILPTQLLLTPKRMFYYLWTDMQYGRCPPKRVVVKHVAPFAALFVGLPNPTIKQPKKPDILAFIISYLLIMSR